MIRGLAIDLEQSKLFIRRGPDKHGIFWSSLKPYDSVNTLYSSKRQTFFTKASFFLYGLSFNQVENAVTSQDRELEDTQPKQIQGKKQFN